MTTQNKVGLGFIAMGVVVGFLISALGLQNFKTPIVVGLLVLCFVTIFVISFRARMRQPPQAD